MSGEHVTFSNLSQLEATAMSEHDQQLSPLQKAALAMKVLRNRVDDLENAASAPIAVVGLGCRFPAGSSNPDKFWEAVNGGRDGSMEVPAERWDIDSLYDPTPGVAGKMYVRNSCFIDGVDQFDPLFFRISPREAVGMDPQQRLLLEVAWEALEDAGIAAPSLVGSRTGVYLGISTNDYSALLARTAHGSSSNAGAGAGNAASVASGRISYTFGLQGPCVAIDTACSSSLVAAHLAVQALRNGECELALVAGVNLMLSPEITINFSLGRMLAPDGHCKTFDAAADGYVRGEGCGVLVLKKLSDALAAGDRVHAVIRGSAVNQDGRSAGLTAPNGLAQEAVIGQALANARLGPDAVDYIEAHGTGTSLGDPIEMHALKAVFGKQRERPLYVGSVKTNIGHAEAASGVAGLIKAVLMLRHQSMPPHLNFERLNPHIDLSGIDIRIPLARSDMALSVAGVSSFGFSGTNAHIVLSAAPAPEAVPVPAANPAPSGAQLFLSARTKDALLTMIGAFQALLDTPGCSFDDVCYTVRVGRARLAWWVLVDSPAALRGAVPSNAPTPEVRPAAGRRISVPSYPFERARYWVDASAAVSAPPAPLAGTHPLLGPKTRLPDSAERRWDSVIGTATPGLEFLEQHRVNDHPVMPASAFIEMALAANPGCDLVGLRIPAPLLLQAQAERALHTICGADGSVRIVSVALTEDGAASVTHAIAHAEQRSATPAPMPAMPLPAELTEQCAPALLYAAMEQLGINHGPAFRLLGAVRRRAGAAQGTLAAPPAGELHQWVGLHPAVLDAAIQLVAAALPDAGAAQLLPARIGRISVLRPALSALTVRCTARREDGGVTADLVIEDAQGAVLQISELRFEAAMAGQAPAAPTYTLAWQDMALLDGLAPPRFLPPPEAMAVALGGASERLGQLHGMHVYSQASDHLENLATGYVLAALRELGLAFEAGAQLTFGALAESLGIDERHHRLLARMLGMLEQDGVLLKRGRAWQVVHSPAAQDNQAAAAALLARFPSMAGEIGMVARCGAALAEVLTNRTDPLGLLFPASEEGASVFYATSAYARTVNGLLLEAARGLAATLPPGRALRVLEVGAGTGGATGAILDGLAGVACSYTFTDLSPAFLAEARSTFGERGITPKLLDIERDPASQGFDGQAYDLIIAANVLHATRSIAQSLAHVHGLLADGGVLLLVESTAPRRWVDIVFGLTEGWWRFDDTALRPAHPLLTHAQWQGALGQAGLETADGAVTEVIVARRRPAAAAAAAAPAPLWHIGGVDTIGLCAALEQAGQRCGARDGALHWAVLLAPAAPDSASQQALLQQVSALAGAALASAHVPSLTLIADATLGHAGLAGLVRALGVECPQLKARLLVGAPSAACIVDELMSGNREPEVRWRAARRCVARLAAHSGAPVAAPAIGGTWLITGGFGGLGMAIAGWLVAQGAPRVMLLGRHRGVLSDALLAAAPGTIETHEGDAADPALLARLLAGVDDLEGVVHAAGTLADAPVGAQDAHSIGAVLHPKIGGALALEQAVSGKQLRHFVLFASAAGVLGSANQVNHAFGSTFLDALCHDRRARGLPGLSLDWGVWSGLGAAARQGFDVQAERLGLGSITPHQGVLAFAAALAMDEGQLLVLPSVDWPRFTAHLGAHRSPLYDQVLEQVEAIAEAAPALPAADAHTAAALPEQLARIVASLLSLPANFEREVPLAELGLDSLIAVEIKNQVQRSLGLEVSVRELMEGSTLAELAQRLAGDAGQQSATSAPDTIVPDLAARHLPFPLTDMQQAFWIGRRSDLALGGVNCYLYTEFDTRDIDLARLERAWNRMVRHHDTLRLVIQADGMQRILPEVPDYRFALNDLRQLPPERAQDELSAARASLARRSTEAGTWPLFDIRVSLYEDLTRLHFGFDLIALDAASIFAIRQELARLYDEPETPLEPLGISFRDYVMHLEKAQTSAQWKASEQYWYARALTLPGAPDLPLTPVSARAPIPAFARHRFVLPAAQSGGLRLQAQQRGLTIASTLAAVYAEALAMWSRSEQFCLTMTLFNRPPLHPDMASLIGDFTSTILLEVDARAPTFGARAIALMRQLAADLDHARISGIAVLREAARQGSGGLRTIPVVFTSALGFRQPEPGAASPNSQWDRNGTTVFNVSSTPQVWIDCQISEEEGALFCHWDVLQTVFPAGVAEAMFAAFSAIIDNLSRGEGWDQALPATPALPPRAPFMQVEAPECLHAAFERQAVLTPRRTALVAGATTLDYATLELAAAHLAVHVATQLGGAAQARDRLVAVGYPKGWRQVLAVLAVLKAGAAYLPLDPTLPPERRRLLIEQGEAIVLDDDASADAALAAATAGQPAAPLPHPADPTRLAYVIYTSGSTGLPKGVMMEHAGALTTVREINRRWQLGPEDRVLGLSALGFDLSVYDIFGPLSVGAALILPEPQAARDPSVWSALLTQHGVTVWNSVPALMAMQIAFGLPQGHALRLVMLSGDWVPLELVEQLRQYAPGAALVSLGGATEAGIWSNAFEIGRRDPDWPSIPYGYPLAGHQLHVLNRHGADCPDWVTGQIAISGAGLARGYWRDAQRSAERFQRDPVSGQRRYLTGDLGRFRPHAGSTPAPIEFLGREDSQIKLQGHRIELGEIEAALQAHPGVAAAVALVHGAAQSPVRTLHAFVVPAQAPSASWTALLAAGQARAAAVAVPIDDAAFAAVEQAASAHAVGAAAAALRSMAGAGRALDWRSLVDEAGVAPRYQHWLERMLPLVERDDDAPQQAALEQIAGLDRFGFGQADFDLLAEVAAKLPEILTERLHSSDIYLSRQTPEVYAKLFAAPNAVIASLVGQLAQERPLAVLEVGGGLGTTLAAILPELPAGRIDYHFTDLSEHFVRLARARYGELPSMRFGTLDFDQPLAENGVRYDVIIASSALHAAADVARTLARLHGLLAPGGVLIALEQTRFFPWFDLNMGLQAGFDARTDRALRPHHPLLSRQAWPQLMRQAGFADARALVAPSSIAERLGLDVLVARAGAQVQEGAPVRVHDGAGLGAELLAWLGQRLPPYMLPASIGTIARMPLSSNGKVDRAQLAGLLQAQAGPALQADQAYARMAHFKLTKPGLRAPQAGQGVLALPRVAPDTGAYRHRKSYRTYEGAPLTLERLAATLANISALHDDALALPKYRYASAGSLHAVQAWLYVKPGRVAGLDAGVYYYHPEAHALTPINRAQLAPELYGQGDNPQMFEACAFSLFLVGERDAIVPVYGPEVGEQFLYIEADYLGQLLMETAPRELIGLCPIGYLDPAVPGILGLTPSQVIVHSMVGGSVTAAQLDEWDGGSPMEAAAAGPGSAELHKRLRQQLPHYTNPAPAFSPIEQSITVLLTELLPQAQIDPHRSLFDIGATSLTLVSLHRLIAERLGCNLALQAMFEQPTIASLALTVAGMLRQRVPLEETGSSGSPFMYFERLGRAGPRRPTLVMMPGVLGLPFYLAPLAGILAGDVALATMQMPGLFDQAAPLESVEAQAAYAVEHLRRFQPDGPYLIAGHSYGGYVAIEMARRLRDDGQQVPLLVLADSVRTHGTLADFQTDDVAFTAMTRALYALYPEQLVLPYQDISRHGPRAAFDATAATLVEAGMFGAGGMQFDRLTAVFKANFKALGAYRPGPIPGSMTVVRTEGGFPPEFHDYEAGTSLADRALGWTDLVGEKIAVHTMVGDHLSMQNPENTLELAAILRALVRPWAHL